MNVTEYKKEKSYNIFVEAFKRTLLWMLCTLGVLIFFGVFMDGLEMKVNQALSGTLGNATILFTAAIGTPIHEGSHWLMCILFGFRVVDVKLLKPFTYMNDGVLGYVRYASQPMTLRGQIGGFFVGIAPMVFGGLFILLVVRLLLPEAYKEADRRADMVWMDDGKWKSIRSAFAFVRGFLRGMLSIKNFGILRIPICLYLVTSISMHMTYSSVDFENGFSGIFVIAIIYYIWSLLSSIAHAQYKEQCIEIAMFLTMFFSIGVVCDLLLLGAANLFL